MENQRTHTPQRTLHNQIDRFEPIKAIGKLMFFDYNKNKFGFISEVKCVGDVQIDKAHVSESGLTTNKRLNDGEIVTFTLHKGHKGFYATDVKSFDEITLQTISNFTHLIGIYEIEKVIYNTVRNDYSKLDNEDRILIGNLLLKEKHANAWNLLVKFQNDELIETYIKTQIISLSDTEKIIFLKSSFNEMLLLNTLSSWSTQENSSVLQLTGIIGNKKLTSEQVPKTFITIVINLEWTFEEISKIYSVFEVTEIANQLIDRYSFKVYNYINNLKAIVAINSLTDEARKKLIETLYLEKDDISANTFLEIFIDLADYKIINSENKLLEFLSYKVLKFNELSNLISHLTENCQTSDFRKIVSNSIDSISSWKIIELIELAGQKQELAKTLIEVYYATEGRDSSSDYYRLIDFLKKNGNPGLRNYFLDRFYKELSLKYPISILELAILSNHINAQKLSYQNLTFNSETEITNFIDKSTIFVIPNEVKLVNKALTGFLEFLNSSSSFTLTEHCKIFLQINKGIVQCLSVKFLIYQFYKQAISKKTLIETLNSFQWTEISALLIKAFIQESNYTEKILLDKLSGIFKDHFEVLANENFQPKSFLDNFTISNILNRCDGRKYYNAELWQKNGKSRWYVKGGVSIMTKDAMDCYCEGRPWKKEALWDSSTNKPSNQQYEFYWCKTSYCAARNDSVQLFQPFFKWTLSEISATLNISIEKIALATLAGWANRMNKIVEHLFCRKCNHVLRPLSFKPVTLGYYAVPLFHCINDNCTEKQTIRFTHCLNGKCESHKTSEPLDSRDCKSCKPSDINHTGLECNYCGASCPTCSGQHNRIVVQEVW